MNDMVIRSELFIPTRADLVELPPTLDGSYGTNRADAHSSGKQIDANDDAAAIESWLEAKCTNDHTRRSYRREAYRLLVWSVYFRDKPMSSLKVEDIREFERWLGEPVRHPDWPASWNIFNGPLSDASRNQALTILKGMFNWLVSAQYLAGNPFVLMSFKGSKDRSSVRVKLPPKRFFEEDLWKWLTNFLEQLPSLEWIPDEKGDPISLPDGQNANGTITFWTPEKWPAARAERLRFIVLFLYGSAARRAELAGGTMGQIACANDVWYWSVHGKGDKPATVVLDAETMAALRRYRTHRRLAPSPQHGEDGIPIVSKLDREEPVTDWMIYRELKSFLKHAEMYLRHVELTNEQWLGKLKHGSAHWLRHTWASHAAASGVPIRITADQLRHSSTSTTEAIYVHQTLEDREAHIRQLRDRQKQ
jgi:integrase